MFPVRGTGKAVTFAVVSLSDRITVWCRAADRRLTKVFGFLVITLDMAHVAQSRDGTTPGRPYLDSHADSGRGADIDTRRSISAGDIAISADRELKMIFVATADET